HGGARPHVRERAVPPTTRPHDRPSRRRDGRVLRGYERRIRARQRVRALARGALVLRRPRPHGGGPRRRAAGALRAVSELSHDADGTGTAGRAHTHGPETLPGGDAARWMIAGSGPTGRRRCS